MLREWLCKLLGHKWNMRSWVANGIHTTHFECHRCWHYTQYQAPVIEQQQGIAWEVIEIERGLFVIDQSRRLH